MKINLFKCAKNIYYNIDRWNLSECPVLLITGLSGSGKTTYAHKLAQKTNSILISFDVLKFYEEASEESKKILQEFIIYYPEIKQLIKRHWNKTDIFFSNDKLYNYFCNIFYDFIIKYSIKTNKKIILEGIQIFARLHSSKTVNMPLIIIGSSSFKSSINKFNRDKIIKKKRTNIYKYIHDLFLYHIIQYFYLNKYIMYYNICTNYINIHYQNLDSKT